MEDSFLEPVQEVTVINGSGGAGMTLGFGLCEQLINKRQLFNQTVIFP